MVAVSARVNFVVRLERLVMKIENIEKKLENRKRLFAIWTKVNKKLSTSESI